LRRQGQVALVLPVLVVHQDDGTPLEKLLDGLFDGSEAGIHGLIVAQLQVSASRSAQASRTCSRVTARMFPESGGADSSRRRRCGVCHGAQWTALLAPKITTVGRASAAATWVGPESLPTKRDAREMSAISSRTLNESSRTPSGASSRRVSSVTSS